VNDHTELRQVVIQLAGRLGLSAQDCYLTHEGRYLQNTWTVIDADILNEDELQLVCRG